MYHGEGCRRRPRSLYPAGGRSIEGDMLWVVVGIVLTIVVFFYIQRRKAARHAQQQIEHPPPAQGADAQKIASLRTMNYAAPNLEQGQPDRRDCEICLEDFVEGETLMVLDCEHYNHHHYIKKWMRLKNACPICR